MWRIKVALLSSYALKQSYCFVFWSVFSEPLTEQSFNHRSQNSTRIPTAPLQRRLRHIAARVRDRARRIDVEHLARPLKVRWFFLVSKAGRRL